MIQSLILALRDFSCHENLHELIIRVRNKVLNLSNQHNEEISGAQTVHLSDTLRKKLYFFPGMAGRELQPQANVKHTEPETENHHAFVPRRSRTNHRRQKDTGPVMVSSVMVFAFSISIISALIAGFVRPPITTSTFTGSETTLEREPVCSHSNQETIGTSMAPFCYNAPHEDEEPYQHCNSHWEDSEETHNHHLWHHPHHPRRHPHHPRHHPPHPQNYPPHPWHHPPHPRHHPRHHHHHTGHHPHHAGHHHP